MIKKIIIFLFLISLLYCYKRECEGLWGFNAVAVAYIRYADTSKNKPNVTIINWDGKSNSITINEKTINITDSSNIKALLNGTSKKSRDTLFQGKDTIILIFTKGLASPFDGASIANRCPNLNWRKPDNSLNNEIFYDIYLSEDPSANILIDSKLTAEYYVACDLRSKTKYYWKVVTFNKTTNTTDVSSIWSFTTQP